jgi:septum site-determining protein MinD
MLGRMGRKVLIVDADLATAGLSTLMGSAERESNLHDLLSGRGDPNRGLYDAYGVKVLPSGPSVGGFVRANPTKLTEIILSLKPSFDFVIIDTPPGLSKYSLTPLKLADEIISVTTQDPTAVDAAAKLDEVASSLGLKILGVVVNRVRKGGFLKKLRLLGRAQIQAKLKSPGRRGSAGGRHGQPSGDILQPQEQSRDFHPHTRREAWRVTSRHGWRGLPSAKVN